MKPSNLVILAMSGLIACSQGDESSQDPYRPAGSISVDKQFVQIGAKPKISWNINYPENTVDVIEVSPSDSLTLKKKTCYEVRVLGSAVGNSTNGWPVRLELDLGSGWSEIFFGNDLDVKPSSVVAYGTVYSGNTFNLRAETNKGGYKKNNGSYSAQSKNWWGWRSTTEVENTLIALRDGDDVPGVKGKNGQQDAEYFLRPYIVEDANGNGKISIGPKDVIYLFELHSSYSQMSATADMQDLVVLCSFGTCESSNVQVDSGGLSVADADFGKSNNGHGNNIDGIDVSNKGQGGGGPNGENDTDYNGDGIYEDDESK